MRRNRSFQFLIMDVKSNGTGELSFGCIQMALLNIAGACLRWRVIFLRVLIVILFDTCRYEFDGLKRSLLTTLSSDYRLQFPTRFTRRQPKGV